MTDTNRENMEFLSSVYSANKPNLMDKPGLRQLLVGSTGSDSLPSLNSTRLCWLHYQTLLPCMVERRLPISWDFRDPDSSRSQEGIFPKSSVPWRMHRWEMPLNQAPQPGAEVGLARSVSRANPKWKWGTRPTQTTWPRHITVQWTVSSPLPNPSSPNWLLGKQYLSRNNNAIPADK